MTATRDTIAAWSDRTLATSDDRRRFCRALAESVAIDCGLPTDVVGVEVAWRRESTTITLTITAAARPPELAA